MNSRFWIQDFVVKNFGFKILDSRTNLHLVVDLQRVSEVVLTRGDLCDPLLKVEDVNSELVSLRRGRAKQLRRVLHEGLVSLRAKICLV